MKRKGYILASVLAALVLPVSMAVAQEGDEFASAITSGKATVGLRYRYEHVDQDSYDENADASTLRLRLNYKTGAWKNWSAFTEFDYVFHLLMKDFNSGAGTSPNKTDYPVVADPKGPDLNQLYFDYSTSDEWKLRFGRQRILLDNQRFVGGVGWRQNEQTYDAATFTTKLIPRTAFSYSYLNYVRRIFGSSVPAGKSNLDGHLLNGKVKINDAWAVVPYVYYLDYKDQAYYALSTATAGARLTGDIKAGEGKIGLFAEVATQSEVGDAPVDYDAQYAHIGANWVMKNGLTLGLAYESLGGSTESGMMFRTPLATLHAFQGWADKFLLTPGAGINDVYATAKYKTGKWNFTAVYHDFTAEATSDDFGSEFDLSAGRSLGDRYGVLFKGAFFSSDSDSYDDTSKFWIMLTANY